MTTEQTSKRKERARAAMLKTKKEPGRSQMEGKTYSSVEEMVRAVSSKEFADEFEGYAAERRLVTELMALRAGLSQKDIAKRMKCSQSRISKLEKSTDRELRLADVVDYANALGLNLGIRLFSPRPIADQIKAHALKIKDLLDRLAGTARDDAAVARGAAELCGRLIDDVARFAQRATEGLPAESAVSAPGNHIETETDIDDDWREKQQASAEKEGDDATESSSDEVTPGRLVVPTYTREEFHELLEKMERQGLVKLIYEHGRISCYLTEEGCRGADGNVADAEEIEGRELSELENAGLLKITDEDGRRVIDITDAGRKVVDAGEAHRTIPIWQFRLLDAIRRGAVLEAEPEEEVNRAAQVESLPELTDAEKRLLKIITDATVPVSGLVIPMTQEEIVQRLGDDEDWGAIADGLCKRGRLHRSSDGVIFIT
jgi:transcriptional regulator with XRE-family HTH domain